MSRSSLHLEICIVLCIGCLSNSTLTHGSPSIRISCASRQFFFFPQNADSVTVVALQMSHRSAMPHMEEVPYNSEEYGTYNPSFSFQEKPVMFSLQDLTPCQEPAPTRSAADTSFTPAQPACSPVIPNNNVSTPTKSTSSSPTSHPATVDVSPPPTTITQDAAPHEGHPASPTEATPNSTEALPSISPSPTTNDVTNTPPLTCLDQQTTQTATNDVASPSSQSSIPCSQTRVASAEIDKPFCKPRVKTPPYSPLLPSPLPKQMATPSTTLDNAPLKAVLVHTDTSPIDTPLTTPKRISLTLSTEIAVLSTSLDQTDQSENPGGAADAASPPQDRRPSTNSGNTQDGHEAGDADDAGFLGDEDANKNSEDELDPEEEELLRVLSRCNPIFLTFSK